MRIRSECTCPLEIVHDIIKGKWKMVILWQLHYHERASLATLHRDIKGISQKMLIEQLNELK
ncbi:MAG: winged helix-turn-helix transcriptional regulator, partial [Bacilli bacterium]